MLDSNNKNKEDNIYVYVSYFFFKSYNLIFFKKVQKEPIPEEQELDFRPSVAGEEHSNSDGSIAEEAREADLGLTRVEANECRKESLEDRQSI